MAQPFKEFSLAQSLLFILLKTTCISHKNNYMPIQDFQDEIKKNISSIRDNF
jgi:hypothetical protein